MRNDTKMVLPTLEEIRMGINHLKSVNWQPYKKGDDIREYENLMHKEIIKCIKIFPQGVLHLDGLNQPILKFFRARPCNEIGLHELRAEYSYPPISYSAIKRANLQGYPVFYCAFHAITAIMEVIQNRETFERNRDKLYCISSWRIKDSRNLKLASFIGAVDKEHFFYSFSQFQLNELKRQFSESTENEEQVEAISELYEFLSNTFLEDKEYGISSYLAHKYLYARHTHRADVLMYPSITTDKRTINFAINPNFVDERMYLKYVYLCRVDEVDFNSGVVKFSLENIGVNKETIIHWKKKFDIKDPEILGIIKEDLSHGIDKEIVSALVNSM